MYLSSSAFACFRSACSLHISLLASSFLLSRDSSSFSSSWEKSDFQIFNWLFSAKMSCFLLFSLNISHYLSSAHRLRLCRQKVVLQLVDAILEKKGFSFECLDKFNEKLRNDVFADAKQCLKGLANCCEIRPDIFALTSVCKLFVKRHQTTPIARKKLHRGTYKATSLR